MKLQNIKTRIDSIVSLSQRVLASTYSIDLYSKYVDSTLFSEFRVASLSFLKSIFGDAHPFYVEFDKKVRSSDPYDTAIGQGILFAAKQEIDNGWLTSIKGIVSSEIFSNFLDMAVHLLEQGYKDPAAVMTGSVLEEHLRQLCQDNALTTDTQKEGRSIPKKSDTMNAELAKASVYNALSQKSVTAWLDLRYKAAHGKYTEYTSEEVRLMQQGVTDFIARTS